MAEGCVGSFATHNAEKDQSQFWPLVIFKVYFLPSSVVVNGQYGNSNNKVKNTLNFKYGQNIFEWALCLQIMDYCPFSINMIIEKK